MADEMISDECPLVTDDLAAAMRDPRYWRGRDPDYVCAVVTAIHRITASGQVDVCALLAENVRLQAERGEARLAASRAVAEVAKAEQQAAAERAKLQSEKDAWTRQIKSGAWRASIGACVSRGAGPNPNTAAPASVSAVYFLYRRKQIVYVGRTTNLWARIGTHSANRVIKFDRWSFLDCPPEELGALEREWIDALQPEANRDATTLAALRRVSSPE